MELVHWDMLAVLEKVSAVGCFWFLFWVSVEILV